MGRKKVPGLINRKGIWHVDKVVRGRRICESSGESDIEKAEEFLARRIEQIRQASVYGVCPKRHWRLAATKHLNEATKASIKRDAELLKVLDPEFRDDKDTGIQFRNRHFPFPFEVADFLVPTAGIDLEKSHLGQIRR